LLGLQSEHSQSLPFASSLCGACYEVCPVKINIPEILVYLRQQVILQKSGGLNLESTVFSALSWVFGSAPRYESAQKLARFGQTLLVRDDKISSLPGMLAAWTHTRDLPAVPAQAFRDWWRERAQKITGQP
jgi:L-lactate dehydrogenase complex protein LldF